MERASRYTEITPLNPLGTEKFGVKISNLTPNISQTGEYLTPIFCVFENPLGIAIDAETLAFLALEIAR